MKKTRLSVIAGVFLIALLSIAMISCSASKAETWKVTVTKDDGTVLGTASVVKGDKYTLPETFKSIEEGYRLVSYSDGTTTYNPKDEIEVTSDITLTAKICREYTVTFKDCGRDHAVVKVLAGGHVDMDSLAAIADDDNSTQVFDHWKIDDGSDTTFDGNYTVNSDLTVVSVYRDRDTGGDD